MAPIWPTGPKAWLAASFPWTSVTGMQSVQRLLPVGQTDIADKAIENDPFKVEFPIENGNFL